MVRERVYENGYRATQEFPEYIDHYIYFSTQGDADSAAAELVKRGWPTRVGPSAGGEDWLLLATQPATGNEERKTFTTDFPNSLRISMAITMDGSGPPILRMTL